MVNADNLRKANPWQPMYDPQDLKHLGKLGEEAAELCSAISRCIIQGIDEKEPVTGKPNREWLEDEIADVAAGISLAIDHFNLDMMRMEIRTARKVQHLRDWHTQVRSFPEYRIRSETTDGHFNITPLDPGETKDGRAQLVVLVRFP